MVKATVSAISQQGAGLGPQMASHLRPSVSSANNKKIHCVWLCL